MPGLRHPLETLSPRLLRASAAASSAGALVLGGVLTRLGRPLSGPASPHGLASFELQGSTERMRALLAAWGEPGRTRAALMTWIDYGFIPCYALSLSALALALPGARAFPGAARAAAWAVWAAAVFDGAENAFGLCILGGGGLWPASPAMAFCAAVKFGLILLCAAWLPPALFMRAPRD